MRFFLICLFVSVFILSACQGTPVVSSVPVDSVTGTSTFAPATSSPSETPSPTETVTPTIPPAGLIRVDTLEQEAYPFVENGKCSLGEAIFAANSGEPKD